jgi:hypothetical protein
MGNTILVDNGAIINFDETQNFSTASFAHEHLYQGGRDKHGGKGTTFRISKMQEPHESSAKDDPGMKPNH